MPTNYGVARRPLRQDFQGTTIVKFMHRKDHHWTIWFDDGDKLDVQSPPRCSLDSGGSMMYVVANKAGEGAD
jgi:hypothetical protein